MKSLMVRVAEAAKKGLTPTEINALAEKYQNLKTDVQLGAPIEEDMMWIAGAIMFLQNCGKIQDDEELWMLMNDIEAGKEL